MIGRIPSKSRSRRGGALALSLIAVSVISVIGGAFLLMTATISRQQQGSQDRSEAFYLAEAGLAEAYAGLAMGKTGSVGSTTHPAAFGNGLFWVEATRVAEDRIELKSTGMAGSGRVVLSLVAEKTALSSAALGVFTPGALTISAGATVDAYDSRLGTYAEQAELGLDATAGARLGSNAELSVQGTLRVPTLVNGNVASGPGSPLTLGNGVTVTGTAGSAGTTFDPPQPTPPDVDLLPPLQLGAGSAPIQLPAGLYGITSLSLADGASVQIAGPSDMVVGNLTLAGTASLLFDTSGGPINLYVQGQLVVAAESTLGGLSADPTLVTVQVSGAGPVQMLSAQPFYGTLYAPEAQVATAEGFELFGSAVAGQLLLGPKAKLHFDRALLADAAGAKALPELLAWRIVDLGPETVGPASSSPFRILGVEREDLNGPSEEHADQELTIEYVDAGGTPRSYTGPESGFDWSNVSSVISLQRDGEAIFLGTDEGEEAQEPGEDEHVRALQELFGSDPPKTSAEIRAGLLAASPLPSSALRYVAKIEATGSPISSADLNAVLQANSPMSPALLTTFATSLFANEDPLLTGQDMLDVLLANTPMPLDSQSSVLGQMITSGTNPMNSQQMVDVLIPNSPLPNAVIRMINAGMGAFTIGQISAIQAAQ